MAEVVIDFLEAIQVDNQQYHLRVGAPGAVEGACKAVFEEPAIGKACQWVVQGQMLVVFNLIFQQQQDHPYGDNVFRQIPDFGFNLKLGETVTSTALSARSIPFPGRF